MNQSEFRVAKVVETKWNVMFDSVVPLHLLMNLLPAMRAHAGHSLVFVQQLKKS